jgi:hypothetical protein
MSSSFEEIIKNKTYPELTDFIKSKDLISSEGIADNQYVFTVMGKSNDNSLNVVISSEEITAYILDKDKQVLEKLSHRYKDPDDMLDQVKNCVNTFEVFNDLGIDSGDDKILNEEEPSNGQYSSIVDGLSDISNKMKSIGDSIKSLSGMSQDVEIISNIMSLSSSAYELSIDANDSIKTYNDILDKESEEAGKDKSESFNISKKESMVASNKLKILEAMISAQNLSDIDAVSEDESRLFTDVCMKILNNK